MGAFSLESRQSLISRVEDLSFKLDQVNLDFQTLHLLELENEELKAALGRSGREKIILAAILSRPPRSPYDTLILDRGSTDGVKKGDIVSIDNHFLVGEIVEVGGSFSKVELFSSPGKETEVQIGKDHIQTIVYGFGAGNFRARLPQDTAIAVGDVVSMTSFDIGVLGFVAKIEGTSADAFRVLYFRTPFNLSQTRMVEIGAPTTPSLIEAESLKDESPFPEGNPESL